MSSKKLKRFLSVVLSLSMVLSVNTINFAADVAPGSEEAQVEADADAAADAHQHDEGLQEAAAEDACAEDGHVFEDGVCTVCQEVEGTEAGEAEEPEAEAEEPAEAEGVSVGEDVQEEVFAGQAAEAAPQADSGDANPEEPEKDPTKCDGDNHVAYTVTVVRAATCTTSGMGKRTCQCKKDSSFVTLKPRHSYQKIDDATKNPVLGENGEIVVADNLKANVDYFVRAEATCTSSGLVTYKCTVQGCGNTQNVTTAPLKHSFEREEGWPEVKPTPDETVPAKCGGTPGKNVWKCDDCDYAYEEVIQPTGKHNYVDTVVAETCTTPRSTIKTCSVCKEVEPGAKPVPITGENGRRRIGHSFEATTALGVVVKEDISDGIYEISSKVLPIEEKPATCLEDGYKVYKCVDTTVGSETRKGCGFEYTVVVKARGSHEEKEIADFIPPTCTENAKYVMRCKHCNEVMGEEIDALELFLAENDGNMEAAIAAAKDAGAYQLGHVWGSEKVEIEGSCTQDGVSTFTCDRCGEVDTREVPARHEFEDENHNLKAGFEAEAVEKNKLVIYKDPTCTETGIAYCTCTKCDTRRTDIVIPAIGHDYGDVVTSYENYESGDDDGVLEQDFVCHDGKVIYTCQNGCGHSYSVDIPAKPHKPADIADLKDATCTEPAMQATFCTECGDATSDAKIVAPKLGHSYEVIGEDGEVVKDKDGNIVINESAGKPAEVPATCMEEGTLTYTCTTCGEEHVIIIPKKPHEMDIDAQDGIIAPTCKENGKIKETCQTEGCDYYEIKDVTEVFTDEEITAMDLWKRNGHEFKLKAVFTEPTCTRNGIALYECTLCHDTENRTLNAHHSYTDEEGHLIPADEYVKNNTTDNTYLKVTKKADCENDGIAIYTCMDCQAGTEGHTYEGKIEKLGHQFDDGVAASNKVECQPGTITYTCQRVIDDKGTKCGKEKVDPMPETAKEHIYVEKNIPATCVEPEKTGKFCKWCNQAQPGTTPTVVEGSKPSGHTYASDEENGLALTDAEGNTVYVKKDAELTVGTDYTVDKEAKCKETGARTYKCTTEGCGNEIALTVPELGHDFSGDWVVQGANCTDPSRKERTCKNGCGEKEKVFIGSKPAEGDEAHRWVRDEGQEEVTCGEVTFTCEYNPAHTKTEEVHNWDTENPTTTTHGGFKVVSCTECDATMMDDSEATEGFVYCDTCKDGVEPEKFGAYPATCEKAGKTNKEVCPTCGKTFKEAEDIPATGHEYVREVVKEPSCVDGYSEEVCQNGCGKTRNREVIPATGEVAHKFAAVEGQDYKECSECHTKDVIAATRMEAVVEGGKNLIRLIADAQLVDEETYEIVQRGLIYYTAAEGYPGRLDMDDVGNVDKVKMKEITDTEAIGARLPINIGTATTRVIYARAYVAVMNKSTSKIEIRYGETISGSFESLGGGR